jgi:hypothetical protein
MHLDILTVHVLRVNPPTGTAVDTEHGHPAIRAAYGRERVPRNHRRSRLAPGHGQYTDCLEAVRIRDEPVLGALDGELGAILLVPDVSVHHVQQAIVLATGGNVSCDGRYRCRMEGQFRIVSSLY